MNENEVLSRSTFTRERTIHQNGLYVFSAIPCGQPVHSSFLKTLNFLCENINAELMFLMMRGWERPKQELDISALSLQNKMYTNVVLGKNLRAVDFRIAPQQIQPLTGMDRIGQKSYSIIVAATKQNLRVVPTGDHPHLVCSTGCATYPVYSDTRISELARQDHTLGAILVIKRNKKFFVRHLRWCEELNGIIDLGYLYTDTLEKKWIGCDSLVCGDFHSGWTNKKVFDATLNQIEELKAKSVILHDCFDGTSISHHTKDHVIERTQIPPYLSTLKKELRFLGRELKKFNNSCVKRVVLVRSNHDEHLDKYLTEGRFANDDRNFLEATELARVATLGINPIKYYLFKHFPELREKTRFLKRDSLVRVNGVLVSAHGDKGANGSFGSSARHETSYGNAITGHTHSPHILRDVWTVGTMSNIPLPYSIGSATSWLNANIAIYKYGIKQMFIIIDGEWK